MIRVVQVRRLFATRVDGGLISASVAIFLGLAFGALILKAAGIAPLAAYAVILKGAFGKPASVMYAIVKATPLIFTGLSIALAFRGGLFNIGAEGQFIVAALAAALTGYYLQLPAAVHVPVVFLIATAAAGLWGGIAGFLKARYGTHEVVSTIMLNWIALHLQNFVVMTTGFRKPDSEASFTIRESASITLLGEWKYSGPGQSWLQDHSVVQDLLRAPVNFGIVVAVAVALALHFILKKTTAGYTLRAIGFNRRAAAYGGIDVERGLVMTMVAAGAIAGAGGALHVMGVAKNIALLTSMEGYGFDGLAVALMGNASIAGCGVSALLLGALKYGGAKMQAVLGAPSEIIVIITGAIVFFVGIPRISRELLRARRARIGRNDA